MSQVKKKKNKINWQKLLTSKKFLISAALIIAVAAVIGYKSFAGTCVVGNSIGCPTVKYGARNSAVTVLQKELNYVCYGPLKVDGIFGSNTLRVVRAYQSTKGLTVDGIVGPKTWAKLDYNYDHVSGYCD